jgi:hypothetical protein
MTAEAETLTIYVRLVGDVTGKVYAEEAISTTSIYKDPDLYLGYTFLAAPFTPSDGKADSVERPALDPEDDNVKLQVLTITPLTTEFKGHWTGSIEHRPKARIELSDPTIIT